MGLEVQLLDQQVVAANAAVLYQQLYIHVMPLVVLVSAQYGLGQLSGCTMNIIIAIQTGHGTLGLWSLTT